MPEQFQATPGVPMPMPIPQVRRACIKSRMEQVTSWLSSIKRPSCMWLTSLPGLLIREPAPLGSNAWSMDLFTQQLSLVNTQSIKWALCYPENSTTAASKLSIAASFNLKLQFTSNSPVVWAETILESRSHSIHLAIISNTTYLISIIQ
jgi:hypothetical protein